MLLFDKNIKKIYNTLAFWGENMVDKKRIKENWIKDYIPELDFNKIKWVILDGDNFYNFLIENYYDGEYIVLPDLEADEVIPLGLVYTTFRKYDEGSKYLISYQENNKGLKTILSCLKYYENYKVLDLDDYITFANYIETNFFYKGKGLFKLTIKKFLEMAYINNYVITTPESPEGSICHTVGHLKELLLSKGILVFDDYTNLKDDYNNKQKKLAK